MNFGESFSLIITLWSRLMADQFMGTQVGPGGSPSLSASRTTQPPLPHQSGLEQMVAIQKN